MSRFDIAVASCSDRGRRAANEDQVRVCHEGTQWLAVVADGAGGHRGGAEASRRAVEYMPGALNAAGAFDAGALTAAVLAAHRHVCEGQQHGSGLERMLSTVVALWIDTCSGTALWTHVGDSRLYVARRGALRQLTSDDSVVQRMLDAGLLTRAQAEAHPNKNQLVAALGVDDELQPHTVPRAVPLQAGDAFLLCSDGWWGSLEEGEILEGLAAADTPQEWLAAMQGCIARRGEPRQDNFSAIAAWVVHPAVAEPATAPALATADGEETRAE